MLAKMDSTYVPAAAVRLLLALLGIGRYLIWKVEVSTPANTLLQVREGLRLKSLGVPPYSGSACHAPPLVLALLAATAQSPTLYVLPNILFDLLAGLLVARIAAALLRGKPEGAPGPPAPAPPAPPPAPAPPSLTPRAPPPPAGALVRPGQLAALYLWSPFTIASCVSGSLTSLENLAVMLAAYGAVSRRPPACMFGLALGAYLSLSPGLLLVSGGAGEGEGEGVADGAVPLCCVAVDSGC
jgi:phosphatidylinositol glycan class U